MTCKNCEYDMGDGYRNCGASQDGVCPECGHDEDTPVTYYATICISFCAEGEGEAADALSGAFSEGLVANGAIIDWAYEKVSNEFQHATTDRLERETYGILEPLTGECECLAT